MQFEVNAQKQILPGGFKVKVLCQVKYGKLDYGISGKLRGTMFITLGMCILGILLNFSVGFYVKVKVILLGQRYQCETAT